MEPRSAPLSYGRNGIVLIATLLLLLALSLLAAGLVFAANQATLLARARVSIVQSRFAAEAAVAEAVSHWSTQRVAELPLLGRGVLTMEPLRPTGPVVTAQNLGVGLYLVTGQAFGEDGRAGSWAAALVRTPLLRDLWRPFSAGLTLRDAGGSSSVSAHAAGALEPPPDWGSGACPRAVADSMLAILGDTLLPAVAIDSLSGDTAGFRSLGPLTPQDLQAVADRIELGNIALAPVAAGGICQRAAPGNWGDPLDPASACGTYFPLIFAPGDLSVTGAGQGVLVVAGNLSLQSDARFYGPVLVGGQLTAANGSAVFGAVRAARRTQTSSGASSPDAATVRYNACTLYHALRLSPALDRAFRPRSRWWLPLF